MPMPCPYEPGTHKEWLVTGDAGPGFGPYRHVFTDEEKLRAFLQSAHAFMENVADIKVHERRVYVDPWQEWGG